MNLKRKPKIGLLLIGAERFCPLGAGTVDGTYLERKQIERSTYIDAFDGQADMVASGVVCTRPEAEQWAKRF